MSHLTMENMIVCFLSPGNIDLTDETIFSI